MTRVNDSIRFVHYGAMVLFVLVFTAGLYWAVNESWFIGKATPPMSNIGGQLEGGAVVEPGQFQQNERLPDKNSSRGPEARQELDSIATHILPGTSPAQSLEGVVFEDSYLVAVLPGVRLLEDRDGGVFEDLYEKRVIEQRSMLETDEVVESTVYQDNYEVRTLKSDYVELPSYMQDNFERRVIPFTHPELSQEEYLYRMGALD